MPLDFSLEIKLQQNLNFGIILDVNSRLRVLKVKFLLLMKSSKEDLIMLKLSVLFLDMNQEQEITICINNTEMYHLTELLVNFTQKCLVITEPLKIQFP